MNMRRYEHDGDIMRPYELGEWVQIGDYEALYEKYKQLCDMMDALTEEG